MVIDSALVGPTAQEEEITELSSRCEPGELEFEEDRRAGDVEALRRVQLEIHNAASAWYRSADPLREVHVL